MYLEKENAMNKRVGLWVDRKKAVIVSIANNIEARSIVTSNMENCIQYSSAIPGDGSPEEPRDQRFWKHLGDYYARVIEQIHDAKEIQIFGPEVAKYELRKHMEDRGLAENIVSVEEAGMLTMIEIATIVQKRFPVRSRFDLS
jgi:stalled ribosome rescue protein Dom34